MYKIITTLGFLLASQVGIAHEGHNEPKSMPAPKGGVTRANENYFFEYVYKTGGGTLYLYTHDSLPAKVAAIEASATFEIPRKPKVEAKLTAQETSWNIEAKLPKTHRLTLKFKIKEGAHGDTLTYVVEPK